MLLGTALLVVGILFFVSQLPEESSPVSEKLPEYFDAPDFDLVNSQGEQVTKKDLLGTVWLVDFIFTRCTGPCPIMTQRMTSIQKALQDNGLWHKVKLVSISVDPAYDTPEVLSQYAEAWKADTESWLFLTGQEEYTLELVRDGFKITAQREGSGTMDHGGMPNIMHSTSFLLVDKKGTIRKILALDEPDLPSLVVDLAGELVNET